MIFIPTHNLEKVICNTLDRIPTNFYSKISQILINDNNSDDNTKLVIEKYSADAGFALVMNINNGEVLSMSSLPDFDPNKIFGLTDNAFPDTSHFGGGMMIAPNVNGEGGWTGMHVDADVHGVNTDWKREYSAILCVSEKYDSSFDLLIHDGKKYARIPYKFNRLNVFKCSENSWHGFPQITEGFDRKTLGVMYWSVMTAEDKKVARVKAKFKHDLEFE